MTYRRLVFRSLFLASVENYFRIRTKISIKHCLRSDMKTYSAREVFSLSDRSSMLSHPLPLFVGWLNPAAAAVGLIDK